jgi:hypothetical protein
MAGIAAACLGERLADDLRISRADANSIFGICQRE